MTIERRLKVERDMGEKKRERERQRREVMAILDVLEWALSRLREMVRGMG
ncbi:MAG: hypothetical protein WC657_06755 [Candidatus Paceibacterota bacterium]|jgi:hypothetical protein